MSYEGDPHDHRRSSPARAALPWLVGALLVLAVAAVAGLATAYAIATLRAVPPPQSVIVDTPSPQPPSTPTPLVTASPEPAPTLPPLPSPTEQASPGPEVTPLVHTVARGESISLIAAQYGVTPEAIIELNELQNPNVIYPGQLLLIPLTGD